MSSFRVKGLIIDSHPAKRQLPSSGQTLALAEPEARLYNHNWTPSPRVPKQMFVLAISQPFLKGLN